MKKRVKERKVFKGEGEGWMRKRGTIFEYNLKKLDLNKVKGGEGKLARGGGHSLVVIVV